MMRVRTWILVTGVGLASLLVTGSILPAQDSAEAPSDDTMWQDDDPIMPVRRGVDPAADRILRDMSDYLAGVESFTFSVEVAEDVVLPHGQMVQYGSVADVAIQRPSKVHSRFRGQERRTNFVLNGGSCTVHDLNSNVYAMTEVPIPIDAAVDSLVERYGINVPLADLVSANPYSSVIGSVQYGYVVGHAMIDGVKCHHLAFAQDHIDWQVWIQTGAEPLVRKLVITYKDEEGWPQYTSRITNWNLAPRLSPRYFEYMPPADADRVEFLSNQQGEG